MPFAMFLLLSFSLTLHAEQHAESPALNQLGSLGPAPQTPPSKAAVSPSADNPGGYVAVTADAGELPPQLAKMVDAIGRVTDTRNKPDDLNQNFDDHIVRGSAFHIGNGLVLSAGHVTESGSCPTTVIEWGYREGREPYLRSKCVRVLAQGPSGYKNDFVVMLVDPAPPVKMDIDLAGKYQAGDAITVMGHPAGRRLRRIPVCKIMKLGADEWERMFLDNCDGQSGNSGGPVISLASLKAVGILTNASVAMRISELTELKEILAR